MRASRDFAEAEARRGMRAPPEILGYSDGRDFVCTAAAGGITITNYAGRAENLDIPRSIRGVPVRMIAKGAFSGNQHLTEAAMPNTIQRVRGLAFEDCISLRKVNVPRRRDSPPGEDLQGRFQERIHIGKSLETLNPGCFFRTYELEDGRNNHPQPLSEITVAPESPRLRAENPFVFSADG